MDSRGRRFCTLIFLRAAIAPPMTGRDLASGLGDRSSIGMT